MPINVETTNVNHIWIDTNRIKSIYRYNDNVKLDKYIKNNLKTNRYTKIGPGVRLSDTADPIDAMLPQSAEKVSAKLLICSNIG